MGWLPFPTPGLIISTIVYIFVSIVTLKGKKDIFKKIEKCIKKKSVIDCEKERYESLRSLRHLQMLKKF